MTFEQARWAWLNGEVVPSESANIHASAAAVFEGIRCYETSEGPAVFRLDEHLERLFKSAASHGMKIPYLRNEIGSAVCQLIEANRLSRCFIRPVVFSSGRAVEVAVLASPSTSVLTNEARYRKWLHFVNQCWLDGAYSALPCI